MILLSLARKTASFINGLVVAGGGLASGAVFVMAIGVTLDVLARFILGAGTKAALEFSGYLLVAVVFLGLAYTHKAGAHIRVDFLIKRLPERMLKWFKVFDSTVFLLYVIFLGYFGFDAVQTSIQFGTTSRTGIDIIVWPFQLIIPVGLTLTSLLLVCDICRNVAKNIRD